MSEIAGEGRDNGGGRWKWREEEERGGEKEERRRGGGEEEKGKEKGKCDKKNRDVCFEIDR